MNANRKYERIAKLRLMVSEAYDKMEEAYANGWVIQEERLKQKIKKINREIKELTG